MKKPYIFTITRNNITSFIQIPYSPESLDTEFGIRGEITETIEDKVINIFGLGDIIPITISGIFTKNEHREIIREFINFYRDWKLNNLIENTKISFFDFNKELFYDVLIKNFTMRENIQRRNIITYSITMEGYNLIEKPTYQEQLIDKIFSDINEIKKELKEKINNLIQDIKKYTDTFNKTTSILKSEMKNLTNTLSKIIGYVLINTEYTKYNLNQLINEITNIGNNINFSLKYESNKFITLNDYAEQNINLCIISLSVNEIKQDIKKLTFFAEDNMVESPEKIIQKKNLSEKSFIVEEDTEINIKGIYLATDTKREGTNYYKYNLGNVVYLTENPGVPINVIYVRLYKILDIQRQNYSNYGTKSNQTIERITQQTLADGKKWNEIVEINNLDYPYISEDISTKASGLVRFFKDSGVGSTTINSGVKVWANIEGAKVNFFTKETKTILSSETYTDIIVEAEDVGAFYNVAQKTIIYFKNLPDIEKIENPKAFNNGKLYKVINPLEFIKVPTNLETLKSFEGDDFFGKDIEIKDNDIVVSGTGDIKSVEGMTNYKQQILHRIVTPKGYNSIYPEYGSLLEMYIGSGGTEYIIDLIKLAIVSGFSQDPRTENVESLTLRQENDKIYIKTLIKPYKTNKTNMELEVEI